MQFQPEKISSQHVISAANKIEAEKLKLHPSTGYDVIINGKPYPPKEIIRISHQFAVGADPGIIYGGEQVNKYLKALGFEIVQKMSVWKLGCNWGKGAPSFYEFIKSERILIGIEKYNFKVGDLIIVCEGFRVNAIAKVLTEPKPITQNEHYEEFIKYYEIDYEDWVTYATADWYELSETDTFIYELQQGIRKVQKNDIKEKVINIWESRDVKRLVSTFYVKGYHDLVSENWSFPCLVISKNNWDDYGYKTSFELTHYRSINEKLEIGQLKILDFNQKSTVLPQNFDFLESNYCSLGGTLEYYKTLKAEFPESYLDILKKLNDTAFYDEIKRKFSNHDGFGVSLLRSTEAQLALNDARFIVEGVQKRRKFNFTFEYKIKEALEAHKVDFSFNEVSDLPNYLFCVVGKNGTGKTRIISQLANKLTNSREEGLFYPERPSFSKIIATSFSYFDKFKFPEKQDVSYEFIGIRTKEGLLTDRDISVSLWNAFKEISGDKKKMSLWLQSIESSLEKEYLDFSVNQIISISTRKEFIEKTDDIFSSGQKIVFQFITKLISVIDINSLLIFDEPETHLHPNIVGRLIRTINNILEEYHSFCILSTHSPIVVQEIPSKFIRVFDRQENFPIIYSPPIECFGENLSNISNSIFRANEETELYKNVLLDLVSKYSLVQIERIFDDKLSLNAKLYLQSVIRKKQ